MFERLFALKAQGADTRCEVTAGMGIRFIAYAAIKIVPTAGAT
jgi:xanthine/uracil/vitamin C permease (AzgA family)